MFSKTKIESYRRKLLALHRRVGGDLSLLREDALQPTGGEDSGGLSNVPIHMADLGSRLGEVEVTMGLMNNEERLAAEVIAALTRLDQGTFGQCEDCGKQIARNRLQALPYARRCTRCARENLPEV